MKKHELLQREGNLVRYTKARSGFRKEIILALPADLDVLRVNVSDNHMKSSSSSQGVIEVEVDTFTDALTVLKRPELAPVETVRVTMERPEQGFIPTVSFYPKRLVSLDWVKRYNVTTIYPVIFQMTPMPGKHTEAKVYLEWFTLIREGLFANVRVFILNHRCFYAVKTGQGWQPFGYPRGFERTLQVTHSSKPYLSVYWDITCFNEEFTLNDLLAEGVQANA